jgi:hypothetical protein
MNANQYLASPASQDNTTSQRDTRALFAVPAIGAVATVASGIVALVATGVVGALFTVSYDPHEPVMVWADAHATDVYVTSHPPLLAACCALIAAATALAAFRRRVPAALLLCAAAAIPWYPAMAFLHHVWQLAPAS